jgi:hypothetical protein
LRWPVDFAPLAFKFNSMKRLAPIAMFLAWLVYGARPAVGMPALAQPMQHATMQHGDPAAHAQHMGAAPADTLLDAHGKDCADGAKICSAPFCAACLSTVPAFAARNEGPYLHEAPAPSVERALVTEAISST